MATVDIITKDTKSNDNKKKKKLTPSFSGIM